MYKSICPQCNFIAEGKTREEEREKMIQHYKETGHDVSRYDETPD